MSSILQAPRVYQLTQGPSKFFKIYPLYVILTEYFDPSNYQTRMDESLILLCIGRLVIRQYLPLKLQSVE
jgi:hypothetical protein